MLPLLLLFLHPPFLFWTSDYLWQNLQYVEGGYLEELNGEKSVNRIPRMTTLPRFRLQSRVFLFIFQEHKWATALDTYLQKTP